VSDEIINFYKKVKEEPEEPIKEQKEELAPVLPQPDEPFDKFLLELAEKLKTEKVITEKQQEVFVEQVQQPVSEDTNDPFKKFLDSFASNLKEDKIVNREENIKEATISFINKLKEEPQKPFIIKDQPLVKAKKKDYLPQKFAKKLPEPVIEEPVEEELIEPIETVKPQTGNKYVQELQATDKVSKKQIPEKIKKLSDIKAVVTEQVTEQFNKLRQMYPNFMPHGGGGGGTNAVQYAGGGTMDGDLNVTGKYLSGGIDIGTLIGAGSEADRLISGSQSLVLTPNGSISFPNNFIVPPDGEILNIESETNTSELSGFTRISLSPFGFFAYDNNNNSISFSSADDTIVLASKDEYEWKFNSQGILEGPNNTLTVNGLSSLGNILSGGVELHDIFLTSETDSQTLTYTESSAELSISNGNTVSLSALIDYETAFSGSSAKYEDTSTVVQSNSSNWNFGYNVATYVQANSADWEESAEILPTVTNYLSTNSVIVSTLNVTGQLLSANTDLFDIFLTSETDSQTLTFTESSAELSISNGNTVSLSALIDYETAFSQSSAKYEDTYTTVQDNSATTWNYQGTDLKELSSNWQSTYETICAVSADWAKFNEIVPTVTNYLSTNFVTISTLDVSQQLLSAGTDLFDIFLTSETDSQTLTFTESSTELSISNGNTVLLSSLNDKPYVHANFLPLSGGTITGNLSVLENLSVTGKVSAGDGVTTNYIDFDLNPTTSIQEGRLQWNDDKKTLDLGFSQNNVLHLGQETEIYVRNTSGGPINKGEVVYIFSSSGQTPTIRKAIANSTLTSSGVGIVATTTIPNNQFGYIITNGLITNIKTNYPGWAEGQYVFVSHETAGALINERPPAPFCIVNIGVIANVHANEGKILINSFRSPRLRYVCDVDRNGANQSGQFPVWDQPGPLSGGIFKFNYNINDFATLNTLSTVSATLLPTSTFQSASGNFTTIPTVVQYLSTNNISLSGVTLNPATNLSNFNVERILQDKLTEVISVKDFGARGDGIANDWLSIQRALSAAAGIARLYIPPGLYMITQELRMPSNTYVYGAGIGTTVIKLSAGVSASQNVLTNSQNTRSYLTNQGNENIIVKDLELDGNAQRFAGGYSISGSTAGCALGLASVTNALVENVYCKDACNHSLDVAAGQNTINSDPLTYTPGPSQNVYLKNIIASGAGDDNITFHFSRNITIDGFYSFDSSKRLVSTNSNGLEVDDGCYDIVIKNGYIKGCSRGVEIKGHDYAPAAKRVTVYNVTVENCVRNFDLRHLGFTTLGSTSKTAYDVALYNCTSISPLSSTQLAGTATRALKISSYNGVYVKDFYVVGIHDSSNAVIIQENAKNVFLDGVTFTEISGNDTGITEALLKVDTTANSNITLKNLQFRDCAATPVYVIGSVPGVIVDTVDAITNVTPAPARAIHFTYSPLATPYTIKNVTASGYTNAYRLGGSHNFDYPVPVDVGLVRNIVPASPASANTQYTVARFGWMEGDAQSLNAGIGARIEFTGNIVSGVSANNDVPLAYISTEKINSTDTDLSSRLTFGTRPNNTDAPVTRMSITPAGNVGIGTTTPNQLLTVSGNISATGFIITPDHVEVTDPTKGIVLRSPDNTRWKIVVTDTGTLSATTVI